MLQPGQPGNTPEKAVPTAPSSRKPGRLYNRLLPGVIIIAAGILAYANSFHGPFVFDDISEITQNPSIMVTGPTVDEIVHVLKYAPNRPITYVTLALNYLVGQDRVAGYHAVNLCIHILTAMLIWAVTRRMMDLCRIRSRFLPLGAALVWMTSPVLTQSVTYTIQRATSLATFFYMLSLFCYIRARDRQLSRPDSGRASAFWFSACGVSMLLGFAAKEITVLMPLFVLLYEWYFFQNLNGRWLRQQVKWIALIFAVSMITAGIYLHGDLALKILVPGDDKPFSLLKRSLTEPRVILYYLSLIAFGHPARLILDYDFPLSRSISDPAALLAILALICLAAAAVYAAPRHRLLSYSILWFLGNLAVESIAPNLAVINEHRLYLPSIFPVMAFACGLNRAIGDRRSAVVLLALAVVFGVWTFRRNAVWQNGLDLWLDCARKAPGNARAFNHLGLTCAKEGGHLLQAIDYLNTALALSRKRWGEHHPMTAAHHYNLAEIYRIAGHTEQALQHYRQALALLNPADAPSRSGMAAIYNNLATMEKAAGNMDGAMAGYRKALETLAGLPGTDGRTIIDIAGVYNNMAGVCSARGDTTQAERYLKETLRLLTKEFGANHPLTRRAETALEELPANRTPADQ